MQNRSSLVVEAAHDVVGRYNQDEINGFTDSLLDRMLELVDPTTATAILDAMAGDGNLTLRLYNFCKRRQIPFPSVVAHEYSRVQVEFARAQLGRAGAKVLWGDVLTMKNLETGERMDDGSFDRVMIKSANHEIPLEKQAQLYESIYRVLRPGGLFVNLGFLFDDPKEREELRKIARVKDTFAGMKTAVANRYFLTREELYTFLKQAGFVDIRGGELFEYSIRSNAVARHYFDPAKREEADVEHQVAQVRALTMRRKGRIRFEQDFSIMNCPGEITVVRRPTWAETNAAAFRHCPYDFLRRVECHAQLLDDVVRYIPAKASVLDLGCGPGLLADRLLGKGMTYRGIDISRDFVQSCCERYQGQSRGRFEVGDINTVEFGTGCYEAVAILNTLFLTSVDAMKVLRKIYDALRPEGRLIISGPTSAQSFKRAEPFMKAQLERDGLLTKYEADFKALAEANARLLPNQGSYWSVEGMVALLKEMGYRTIVAHTEIYYGFGYLVVAEK